MESAFGVEHGEVSKAFPVPGMSAAGGAFKKLGQAVGGAGRQGAQKFGQAAGKNINQKGPRSSLGVLQINAGRGAKKIGQLGMQRPGLTGGVAAGGAAAGAGAAGGAFMNRRRV